MCVKFPTVGNNVYTPPAKAAEKTPDVTNPETLPGKTAVGVNNPVDLLDAKSQLKSGESPVGLKMPDKTGPVAGPKLEPGQTFQKNGYHITVGDPPDTGIAKDPNSGTTFHVKIKEDGSVVPDYKKGDLIIFSGKNNNNTTMITMLDDKHGLYQDEMGQNFQVKVNDKSSIKAQIFDDDFKTGDLVLDKTHGLAIVQPDGTGSIRDDKNKTWKNFPLEPVTNGPVVKIAPIPKE
jgi:hypothetical protein